jgi:hypothetical protein
LSVAISGVGCGKSKLSSHPTFIRMVLHFSWMEEPIVSLSRAEFAMQALSSTRPHQNAPSLRKFKAGATFGYVAAERPLRLRVCHAGPHLASLNMGLQEPAGAAIRSLLQCSEDKGSAPPRFALSSDPEGTRLRSRIWPLHGRITLFILERASDMRPKLDMW